MSNLLIEPVVNNDLLTMSTDSISSSFIEDSSTHNNILSITSELHPQTINENSNTDMIETSI